MRQAHPWLSESHRPVLARRQCIIEVTTVGLLLVTLCGGRTCMGQSYDVEAILDGMLAAEAQFRNLQLEYAVTLDRELDQPIRGVYAHKDTDSGNRKTYLAVESAAPIPDMHMQASDSIATYDGTKTIWLWSREGGKGRRAFIDPGKLDFHFRESNPYNPWYDLWQYATDGSGRTWSMAQFMKEHIEQCRIEDPDVTVLGVHTVQFSLVDPVTTGMVRLWVSPERNFLILKRRSGLGDAPASVGVIMADNLVQLPNGLWFPKTIHGLNGDYTISKISTESVPDELFSPKLPSGTLVVDKVARIQYTVGSDEPLDLEDVGSIDEVGHDVNIAETRLREYVDNANEDQAKAVSQTSSPQTPGQVPAGAAATDGGRTWIAVLIVAGVVAAAIGVFTYRRSHQ